MGSVCIQRLAGRHVWGGGRALQHACAAHGLLAVRMATGCPRPHPRAAMLIGRPTFRDTWASYYINKGREDWLPYHDMQHKQDLQALDVQLLPEWQEVRAHACQVQAAS